MLVTATAGCWQQLLGLKPLWFSTWNNVEGPKNHKFELDAKNKERLWKAANKKTNCHIHEINLFLGGGFDKTELFVPIKSSFYAVEM